MKLDFAFPACPGLRSGVTPAYVIPDQIRDRGPALTFQSGFRLEPVLDPDPVPE